MSGGARGKDVPVTVVMSVYNAERYLTRAVRSILEQDFVDFEFIVIDDGSTDGSRAILRSFADERLVVIEQANQGLPNALNRGIRESRAPLIARIDADDIARPDRLRLQVDFLERHSDYVAVGSNATVIDADGDYVYTTAQPLDDGTLRARLPETPFIHPSSMFRKAAFDAAGRYCEQMITAQDTVLFNRLMRLGKAANLAEPLIEYRVVPTSISQRGRTCAEFSRIIARAIEGNSISADDAAHLAVRMKGGKGHDRVVGYHTFLAKKLLWNSYRPGEAREHLRKSLSVRPTWEAGFLYGASFLPETVVRRAYQLGKSLF